MPQADAKNGHQLGIRLDRTDNTYVPGETIIGYVSRKSHIVSPKAMVRISLHARSKSRMVVNRGHITSTYRGRFDLVKSIDYTRTIFQGPLHITVDGREQRWPFAVKLPTHVDLSALGSGVAQDQCYLSLDEANVSTHRLPPTFMIERYQYMSGMSAFVEYFLQAELKTSSSGSTNVTDAILPFKMLHLNLESLNIGPCLQTSHHIHSISSSNLIARRTNAGAIQQMNDLSESSTDPTLVFDIQVQTPTVLKINDPNPIPFFVLAVPDLTKSSDDVQYSSQEIRITHLSMHIIARTEVKCPARKTTRQADNQTQIDLRAENAYRQYGNTLFIPWDGSAIEGQPSQENVRISERESSEPLNVCEKIGLRLERRQDLYATFQTYNIQHTYHLKWEMTIQISGKNFELFGEDVVQILTSPELERSTEWIRPPSEDQLPGFLDVQEDLAESDVGRSGQDMEIQSGGVGGLSRLWDF